MNADSLSSTSQSSKLDHSGLEFESGITLPPSTQLASEELMLTIEDVQKQLRRSRASVYRYTNTEPDPLRPRFDAQKLNPEVRASKEEPLRFHSREVRRFARDILGLNPTIEVQTPPETITQELLKAILTELKNIHETLKTRS